MTEDERIKGIKDFADYLHREAEERCGLYISNVTNSWTHPCIYDYVRWFEEEYKNRI